MSIFKAIDAVAELAKVLVVKGKFDALGIGTVRPHSFCNLDVSPDGRISHPAVVIYNKHGKRVGDPAVFSYPIKFSGIENHVGYMQQAFISLLAEAGFRGEACHISLPSKGLYLVHHH